MARSGQAAPNRRVRCLRLEHHHRMTDAVVEAAPEAAPPEISPDWLNNLAALGWRLLAIAAFIVAALYIASTLWIVSASIAVAVVISAVFAPYVLRIRARGRSRTASAAIVWFIALVVVGGLILLVALAFLPYAVEIFVRLNDGLNRLHDAVGQLNLHPIVETLVQTALSFVRSALGGVVKGIVGNAAAAATVLILAAFLVFFLLRDGDRAWNWLFSGLDPEKSHRMRMAGTMALARVGGYLRGTTILSAILAGTDLVFMWLLGVPLALPLAVLVLLAGYVPYFGGAVASAGILLVTWGAVGPTQALIMLVLMGVRNLFLGYGIRPQVYSHSVNIHPAVVLLVLPAGFALAGVIGLFAAVPVTAVVLVVAGSIIAVVEPHPRPELPGLVPAWLDRMAQWSWRILVAFGLFAIVAVLLTAVPLVTIPVILATIIAATFQPFANWLEKRGWAPSRAAAAAIGGGCLAIVAILVLTVVLLFDNGPDLASRTAQGASTANDALGGQAGLLVTIVQQGGVQLLRTIATLVQNLAVAGIATLLSFLLSFYFLREGAKLMDIAVSRIHDAAAVQIRRAGERSMGILGGYMLGTAIVSGVGALSQWVIMVVLGLPLAGPVLVLSFFLGYIPYIGCYITTGLAFLITIAVGSPTDVVIMAAWTLLFNIIVGNIIGPVVYGRTVQIHPAIVLLAVPGAAAVGGIFAMFLVLPILGVVATTWRTALALLGGDDAPTPPVDEPVPEPRSQAATLGGSAVAST
jgi:predicted PurR-regulated permease PerM